MKRFTWDESKNAELSRTRRISFEEIVFHIGNGDLLDILEHPNRERYLGQRIFVVRRDDYARLSSRDLDAIRKQALREGLPYQTLIASLLHKYASGRLIEA